MAAVAAAGILNPTKPGEFPVVLSDELLGKSGEIYSGLRYNHRPTLSSDTAPATARLKQSSGGSFDLSFHDSGGKYAYSGARSTGEVKDGKDGKEGQYVLIFDPSRRAFVLHRIDSVFNMNMTRTPGNNDAESLRAEFPHLELPVRPQADKHKVQDKPSSKSSAKSKDSAALKRAGGSKKKTEKAKAKASVEVTLPEPEPPKPSAPAKKQRRPVEEEDEESSDDDGGLVVEFPEGRAPPPPAFRPNDFSPAFPPPPVPIRRFSEFERATEQDDEDADGEDEFDPDAVWDVEENNMEDLKLPSPVNNPARPAQEDEDDDAMFDDIEAELEKELQMDSESSVSEED